MFRTTSSPLILALAGALCCTPVYAADADAKADTSHAQAHDLRIKAAELHDQALKEIDDADAKQEESDKAFHEAVALDKKADEIDKVSAEQTRARALRHLAHADERQAETAEAQARVLAQRSKHHTELCEDARQTLNDLTGQHAEESELKLIKNDADENQHKAAEEDASARTFMAESTRLKKASTELLVQADKLDPAGKDKDRSEHRPASLKK